MIQKTISISVKVTTNSRVESVVKINKNNYHVRVFGPAKEGRANARLVELLSKYFDIPKSDISIKKGKKSKYKTILINSFK